MLSKKIYMNLNTNLTPTILQSNKFNTPANLGVFTKSGTSLRSPIIARIHKAKPGCGSCGR